MAIDFSQHTKSTVGIDMAAASGSDATLIVNDVEAPFVKPLMKAWKEHWVDLKGLDILDVVKWELAYDISTISYIIAAQMKNGDLQNVSCTKDYLEDQMEQFAKPNPPKWKQMDTAFCEASCEAFLMEAFGASENNKPVLSIVANKGKIMLANYGGSCPACDINFAKQTVILYGIPSSPTAKPAAYHPGCFMKELAYNTIVGTHGTTQNSTPAPGAMRYALRSMGRTADEMRWRRRAKATCSVGTHELAGGQDPTIPERHKWRCQCKVAPWNLTKEQRAETRTKYGVKTK